MAGISSHALKGLNYPENRFKYNGIEQIGDLGLEDYDAKFRELDPQIGRWWQIDPKTEEMEMWSPYASNYDNPIRFNDVLGDEPDQGGSPSPGPKKLSPATMELLNKVWQNSVGAVNTTILLINQNINPVYLAVNGAQAFFTKKDILTGQKMNGVDATISIASVIPIGKAAGMMERGFVALEKSVAAGIERSTVGKTAPIVESAAQKITASGGTQTRKIYSARELARRTAEPGPFHNFPESFNQVIFENGSKTVTNNYFNHPKPGWSNNLVQYELPGTINGRTGVYEIGVRPSLSGNIDLIWHRFFAPNPKK